MKTNIKMRVTPEQSKKVQEIIFANGGKWAGGEKGVQTKTAWGDEIKFLFIATAGYLTYMLKAQEDDFKKDESKETDADLFIRTNGTCRESK